MTRKILLPTDGSEHAEKTIQYAVGLAKATGATIVAMYAFTPPLSLRSPRGAAMREEFRTSLEAEARDIIAEVAERLAKEGLNVTTLAVEGSPAEAILRAAADEKPDVIVMGSRGSGSLPGLTLGGVAEKVVRYSPVTVTIVK
jgi:nucleotide-binding universal stress UspA family protein